MMAEIHNVKHRMPAILNVEAAFREGRSQGHDRRVLKKYGLDAVIADAAKRQSRRARSGGSEQRNNFETRISAVRDEKEKLSTRVASLLAQAALVEGNAKRLGIDPEELYKPLVPPNRRVSAVFGRKPRV